MNFSVFTRVMMAGMFTVLILGNITAQQKSTPQNWFHLDFDRDGIPGLSTNRAYEELLNGRKSQPVVVAVIDSGIDYEHEDLKPVMWVNEDEIPGNGIDDDNNGYIDDIHGWNFIGNPDGRNIDDENLEIVRLYNQWKTRFEGADLSRLSKADRADYDTYQNYANEIKQKRAELAPNVELYSSTLKAFNSIAASLGKSHAEITLEDVQGFRSTDETLTRAGRMLSNYMQQGETFEGIYHEIEDVFAYFNGQYNYNWNPDFDARHISGDNPMDTSDRNYGNSDVEGGDATHGTHVAGIIGAARGNGLGMDGVADNVRIMSVRAVPNGDERDKDVANAIRYAVDNGAQVINMSFGKGASPQKEAVDEAVRYAVSKDVILIHAAGNDGKENNLSNNFPNDRFARKGLFAPSEAATWIEVGASTALNSASLTADFSNYSPELVDVFAPGVRIYATVPGDEYQNLQGTSMAAPMVAGVAALLRGYFPDLTGTQIKSIIMASTVRYQTQVNIPGGEGEKASFARLCVTGGIVNAYKAIELAKATKGKKKNAPARDPMLR
jgi:subtilisin family serine protease